MDDLINSDTNGLLQKIMDEALMVNIKITNPKAEVTRGKTFWKK